MLFSVMWASAVRLSIFIPLDSVNCRLRTFIIVNSLPGFFMAKLLFKWCIYICEGLNVSECGWFLTSYLILKLCRTMEFALKDISVRGSLFSEVRWSIICWQLRGECRLSRDRVHWVSYIPRCLIVSWSLISAIRSREQRTWRAERIVSLCRPRIIRSCMSNLLDRLNWIRFMWISVPNFSDNRTDVCLANLLHT